MSELISLREFARRLGIGEKTIRDGVKLGKISKGLVNGKIDYEIALQEAKEIGLGKKVINKELHGNFTVKRKPEITKDKILPPPRTTPEDEIPETEIPSLNTSVKKKEFFLARIKELEAKEKECELVKRDIVFSQLFEFHKQIKNNLLSIPDRITDDILHEENRDKAHRTIYDAIADELEKLSDVNNINLKDE